MQFNDTKLYDEYGLTGHIVGVHDYYQSRLDGKWTALVETDAGAYVPIEVADLTVVAA